MPWVVRLCHHAPMIGRLLIVDDHESFLATASALFAEAGFEVVGGADSAASAEAAAGRLRPDVVLLDIQLPDRPGFTVVPLLQDLGAVVVLTSGRREADFGGLVAASGADGFVPKDELSGPRLAALMGPNRQGAGD